METNNAIALNDCHLTSSLTSSLRDSNPSVEAMILEYHNVLDEIHPRNPASASKKIVAFPVKLYLILKLAPKYDLDHIISWQVHGRNFVIRDRNSFLHQIATRVFESTKFASLQRQLNVYDFKIVPSKHKTDKGAYYHPQFLRGRFDLCQTMMRVRIGGERRHSFSSQSSSTSAIPNFYALPFCHDDDAGPLQIVTSDPIPEDAYTDKTTSISFDGPSLIAASYPTANVHHPSQQGIHMDAKSDGNLHHGNKREHEPSHQKTALPYASWDMFDTLDSKQKDQLVKDITLLDELLVQNVTLIRAWTQQTMVAPQEEGSHCGFHTTGDQGPSSQVDWNNVDTEERLTDCKKDREALSPSFFKETKTVALEETIQLPFCCNYSATITLEKVLGGDEALHAKNDEKVVDDFHGCMFHDFEDDDGCSACR